MNVSVLTMFHALRQPPLWPTISCQTEAASRLKTPQTCCQREKLDEVGKVLLHKLDFFFVCLCIYRMYIRFVCTVYECRNKAKLVLLWTSVTPVLLASESGESITGG